MRCDVFAHYLPPRFAEAVRNDPVAASPGFGNWVAPPPGLTDLAERVELLDAFDIDIQIVTTPNPAIDNLGHAGRSADFAKIANDHMAEDVNGTDGRFRGVATISLLDIDGAIAELYRSVETLGLAGALVYASGAGFPLDSPEMDPFYSAATDLDVPLWLHPDRVPTIPEYTRETTSRFDVHLVFGWSFETSVGMARMALGGVFRRHPKLKVIAHHAGAMIPLLGERIAVYYGDPMNLKRLQIDDPLDDFKRFYVDTVTVGSSGALRGAIDFFGADHLLFASDAPFGPEKGALFIEASLGALDELDLSDRDRSNIDSHTAETLLSRG